jgi:hypothetical protein
VCAEALNCQLVLLCVGLADEIMGRIRIEKNDDRVAVERECPCEDMSSLWNSLHSGVVHSVGLSSSNSRWVVGMM